MNAKRVRVFALAVSAMLAAVALLATSASAREPAAGYGDFAGCPSPEEDPTVFLCAKTIIKSGHFQMGSKDVPIKKPITLTGGLNAKNEFVFNSKGGMSKARQLVPGGVIGLTGLDWLVNFLNIEALQLYATTELAGKPGSPAEPILTLPIKVHLENPVLGPNCYVGSNSNPIVLHLTVGETSPPPPNTPISGVTPTEEIDPTRAGVVKFVNGTLVDNAFAAPGASGCVLTLFGFIPISINGLVNSQSGLPAPAGTNETVQNFETDIGFAEFVYP